MIVQCCVCRKIRKGSEWTTPTPEENRSKHISHGYCPHCAAAVFDELDHQPRIRQKWYARQAASALA